MASTAHPGCLCCPVPQHILGNRASLTGAALAEVKKALGAGKPKGKGTVTPAAAAGHDFMLSMVARTLDSTLRSLPADQVGWPALGWQMIPSSSVLCLRVSRPHECVPQFPTLRCPQCVQGGKHSDHQAPSVAVPTSARSKTAWC